MCLGIWWLIEDLGEFSSSVILAYILAVVVVAFVVYAFLNVDMDVIAMQLKEF